MITILTGDNHFLLAQRRRELIGSFLANSDDNFGLERYDAEEDDINQIVDALTALPFLSSERMVVVRGATRNSQAGQSIVGLIERIPESTHAVFVEPTPDKRTKLYKALQKVSKVEQFDSSRGQALHAWMIEFARDQGFELTHGGASELTRRIGSDHWALSQEIHKLSLLDKSMVEADDVKKFIEATLTENVFDLLESMIMGKSRAALKTYRDLRAGRIEIQEVMAMVAWQIQLLLLVAAGENRTVSQLAHDTGFKPFSIERALPHARRVGMAGLRKVLREVTYTDARLKRSSADKDALMEVSLMRTSRLLGRS